MRWIPHSYKRVLPQSVSFLWDNFHGGIVDLRCLAGSTNYQLLLLTAVTLHNRPVQKNIAVVLGTCGTVGYLHLYHYTRKEKFSGQQQAGVMNNK